MIDKCYVENCFVTSCYVKVDSHFERREYVDDGTLEFYAAGYADDGSPTSRTFFSTKQDAIDFARNTLYRYNIFHISDRKTPLKF
jgi:hypothetical protein